MRDPGNYLSGYIYETFHTSLVDDCGCIPEHRQYTVDRFLEDLQAFLDSDYIILWILFSSLIYLAILGIYYVVFKCKKFQNPLKYAFKRSRLWWITALIFPVVVLFAKVIIDFFGI